MDMGLKSIMLSEMIQAEKDKHCMISLMWISLTWISLMWNLKKKHTNKQNKPEIES